jgi:hypothetical protein
VLLVCVLVVCVYGGTLSLNFVKDAASRGAVCNDGSPAGFYFQPGSGSGVHVWVLHQEGGGNCYNAASCNQRAIQTPQLTSSKSWPSAIPFATGIFADDPAFSPTFYNANKVYMGYCSSDNWSGTRVGNGTTGLSAWNFLGHNVTQGIIEDLVAHFGMNTTSSEILFTGCSAGGKGVFANSDWVRSLLPFAPSKYLAFSDAGWNADFPLTTNAFWYQFQPGSILWNALTNPNCQEAHPTHEFLCFFGSIAVPYFDTPTLIHVEQYDNVQFAFDCTCVFDKNNATMMAWMEQFRAIFMQTFRTMKAPHSLFSPACATHCTSLSSVFTTISVNGITLAQHLDKFWSNGGNIPNVIDTCPTFNCATGCP